MADIIEYKLCKDCKYKYRHPLVPFIPFCTYDVNKRYTGINMVTGKKSIVSPILPKYKLSQLWQCSKIRSEDYRCGPEGKLWEPKKENQVEVLYLRLKKVK